MEKMPVEMVEMILAFIVRDNSFLLSSVCRGWHAIIAGYKRRHKLPDHHKTRIRDIVASPELVKWALASGLSNTSRICTIAVRQNRLDVLEWARLQHYRWDSSTTAAAAANLSLVRSMFERGCPMDHKTPDSAAVGGHVAVIEWANSVNVRGSQAMIEHIVRRNDHALFVQCIPFFSHIASWRADALHAAATCGHLQLLQRFHEDKYPMTPRVCSTAALNGHLDIIQWMYDKTEIPTELDLKAAQNGHKNVITWLYDQGYRVHPTVGAVAAQNNQLDTLKMVIGMPDVVVSLKDGVNSVEIIQYLHEQGCHYDKAVESEAAIANSIGVLAWIRATYPDNFNFGLVVELASVYGNTDVLDWVLSTGQPIRNGWLDPAITTGQLTVVYWAMRHNCNMKPDTASNLVRHNDLHLLKILDAHGYKCTFYDALRADQLGFITISAWIKNAIYETINI